MKRYRISFSRIGRRKDVADLITDARNLDEVANKVLKHSRKHLECREVDVIIYADGKDGTIFCGMRVGGRFAVAEI